MYENGDCLSAVPALFYVSLYCFAPHSGQNFVPAGISLPQLVQKVPAFCFAPHSGQNLDPAAIAAPQAEQTAPAAAAGAGAAGVAVLFRLCANILPPDISHIGQDFRAHPWRSVYPWTSQPLQAGKYFQSQSCTESGPGKPASD